MKFTSFLNSSINSEEVEWQKIKNYSQHYYEGNPDISDAEFDNIYDNFKKTYPNSIHLKEVAKGFNPDNTQLQKFEHKYCVVGSLDKIHSVSEYNFNNDYNVSVKLDGSSMVLYIEDGYLVKALSRGDGTYGLDITDKAKIICRNIQYPLMLGTKRFTGAIRGEVVMSYENFNLYKQNHIDAKMPRNVATGLIMRKDTSEDCSYLDFVTYKLLAINYSVKSIPYVITFNYIKNTLHNWGFNVVESAVLNKIRITNEVLKELHNSSEFNIYPTDGIVLSEFICPLTDLNDSQSVVNYTEIAYKFPEDIKETKVVDVEWALSRTGKMVPTVIVEPIQLTGCTVSRATGFNYKYIKDNGIGKGAVVSIMRSGAVVPDIQDIITPSTNLNIPIVCPHCGKELQLTETGIDLMCRNPNCVGAHYANTYRFIEVMCSDIDGVGDKLIEKLLSDVQECASLNLEVPTTINEFTVINYLTITNKQDLVIGCTPYEAERYLKIQECILGKWDKAKFLLAMNIPLLGDIQAKSIANKDVFDSIIDDSKDIVEVKKHCIMDDVTLKLSKNILDNLNRIRAVLKLHNTFKETIKMEKFVAVTGALSVPRKQFEEEIATFNYGITDNMGKAQYLINNDSTSTSSKNISAQRLAKPIITEKQFREMLQNENNK